MSLRLRHVRVPLLPGPLPRPAVSYCMDAAFMQLQSL